MLADMQIHVVHVYHIYDIRNIILGGIPKGDADRGDERSMDLYGHEDR